MTAQHWQHVERLFEEAATKDPPARAVFLEQACGQDDSLRAEIESLIQAESEAEGFLQEPAGQEAPAAIAGQRFGAYRAVKEIGRGGTSSVYLAHSADGSAGPPVAIKVLRIDLDSVELRRRFRTERRVLASLDHPNLARLLDGGTTHDGTPYLVMELVDGERIDTFCARHDLTIAQRLQLFCSICSAVHHAHQRSIIHRDIKPGNVLVTSEGVPKLLDFGIAKVFDPDLATTGASPTATWLRVFTPCYASPEQIHGEEITAASDVYSLGVLLYELLTGRLPFRFRSGEPGALDRMHSRRHPEKPSKAVGSCDPPWGHRQSGRLGQSQGDAPLRPLRRLLAGNLDAILLKAIRREPHFRYPSALALSEDVERHLAGLPVAASRGELGYRLRSFPYRWAPALVLRCLTAVLCCLSAIIILWLRELDVSGPSRPSAVAAAAASSVEWCVPDGGLDDTLRRTDCCSGVAVSGSTVCIDASDWGSLWSSCSQICGSRLSDGCVAAGGVDDTLHKTKCCSGGAVPGSTRCLDPSDFGASWRTCVQTCA